MLKRTLCDLSRAAVAVVARFISQTVVKQSKGQRMNSFQEWLAGKGLIHEALFALLGFFDLFSVFLILETQPTAK